MNGFNKMFDLVEKKKVEKSESKKERNKEKFEEVKQEGKELVRDAKKGINEYKKFLNRKGFHKTRFKFRGSKSFGSKKFYKKLI